MARIPFLGGPSVNLGGPKYSDTRPQFVEGPQAIQGALQSLAGNLNQAASNLSQAAQIKRQADIARVAGNLADVESAMNDAWDGNSQTGIEAFAATQGETALEKSKGTFESVDKRISEIRGKLTPDQVPVFEEQLKQRRLAFKHKMESHIWQQSRVAAKDKVSALEEKTLQSIQGMTDEMAIRVATKDMEPFLRSQQLSVEDGDQLVQNWKARVITARIAGSLASGDIEKAQALLADGRGLMAPKAASDIGKQIEAKKEALTQEHFRLAAQDVAATVVGSAKDENDIVDVVRARSEYESSNDPEFRKKFDQEFEATLRAAKDESDKRIDVWRNTATASVVDYKPIPEETRAMLKRYDPKYLLSLDNEVRSRLDRWKRDQRDAAGSRREQNDIDERVKAMFERLPTSEQLSLNTDQWSMGEGVSPKMRERIGALQKKVRDMDSKGWLANENKMASILEQEGNSMFAAEEKKKPGSTAVDQQALRARANELYRDEALKNGRPPTEEEMRNIASRALALQPVVKKGFLWDSTTKVSAFKIPTDGGAPTTKLVRFPNGALREIPEADVDEALSRFKGTLVAP